MESAGRDAHPQPQVLSMGRNAATRLLEVYVKRSLSVNDGSAGGRRPGAKSRKWVTLAEKDSRVRRHSSDSSAHLSPGELEAVITSFEPTPAYGLAERPADSHLESSIDLSADGPAERPTLPRLESSAEQNRDVVPPTKGAKKNKKPSILKSFLNFFSRKGSEKKEERKSRSPERAGSCTSVDTPSCLPVHGPSSGGDQASPQMRKSLRRKHSRRRFSFRNRGADQTRRSLKKPDTLALSETGHISNAVSVEPTSLYFEKVSEELEKIVKEVKDSPTEDHKIFGKRESFRIKNAKEAEVIESIINLIKQQGDAIDEELKENDNNSVSSFFQRLSYGSFQQLADLYVESGTPGQPPEGTQAAPELVKLAFTLDFTAKVAGLSSHTLGRIMGFGNQYLQDRFTQMSVAHGPEPQLRSTQHFSGPD